MVTSLPAGTPDMGEVIEVVATALRHEVIPATADRPQYVVRMACRLLDVLGRELAHGDRRAAELGERLTSLGATDEADLAAGLVAGRFDASDGAVRALVRELVEWRVGIARPEQLEENDART